MKKPQNVGEWRSLMGRYVRYTLRYSSLYYGGTIDRVAGRNVWIGGNPVWAPDIDTIELRPETAGQEGKGTG